MIEGESERGSPFFQLHGKRRCSVREPRARHVNRQTRRGRGRRVMKIYRSPATREAATDTRGMRRVITRCMHSSRSETRSLIRDSAAGHERQERARKQVSKGQTRKTETVKTEETRGMRGGSQPETWRPSC